MNRYDFVLEMFGRAKHRSNKAGRSAWLVLLICVVVVNPSFAGESPVFQIEKPVSRLSAKKVPDPVSGQPGRLYFTVRCDISSIDKKLIQQQGYDFFDIGHRDFRQSAKEPGDPVLPVKTFQVLIPGGYEFDAVGKVNILSRTRLPAARLFPGQMESPPGSYPAPSPVPMKKKDTACVEYLHTATIRGNAAAVFQFNPVHFIPGIKDNPSKNKGVLDIFETVEVDLILKPVAKKGNLYKRTNSDPAMEAYIESLVINPEDLAIVRDDLSAGASVGPEADDQCDYVIITGQTLMPGFQTLAEHRREMGLKVSVLSVEDIYTRYAGTGSHQDMIKQCIRDYAMDKGTLFILLGGDDTIVPDYDCYASVNGSYADNSIPTDLFYAGLDDMDWNDDKDERACECEGDTIDLYPDVFIGRAPVRSESDAQNFVSKLIAYERAAYKPVFHETALFLGVRLWSVWEGKSDSHWRCEALWDSIHQGMDPIFPSEKIRFYDTGTDFLSGSDYHVTVSHFSDQITSGYGIIFAETHGTESFLSLEGENFRSDNVASCLNEPDQGIIYTTACNTNRFDASTDPGLSESFLRNPGGGSVAYIGSSRYGWGYSSTGPAFPFGSSLDYALEFFRTLYYDRFLLSGMDADPASFGKRLGAVFASHKISYAPVSVYDNPKRWLQFSLNLMGDPFMKILVSLPHDSDRDKDLDGLDIEATARKADLSPPDLWEFARRFGR
ncbi:MAG: C25 family cysteine peptidase [Desulfobacula sp.]